MALNHTKTNYIQLDTSKCKACWICIKTCPSGALSKVDIVIHKHAVLRKPKLCSGCLQCIGVCKSDAITAVQKIIVFEKKKEIEEPYKL